jgi:hypothetical protein
MISPALVKAVEIEKGLKYPVIVVEGAVCQAHQNLARKSFGRKVEGRLSSKKLYQLPGYMSQFTYLNLLVTNKWTAPRTLDSRT